MRDHLPVLSRQNLAAQRGYQDRLQARLQVQEVVHERHHAAPQVPTGFHGHHFLVRQPLPPAPLQRMSQAATAMRRRGQAWAARLQKAAGQSRGQSWALGRTCRLVRHPLQYHLLLVMRMRMVAICCELHLASGASGCACE